MIEAVLQRLILGQVKGDPDRFPPHRVWLWRANVVGAKTDGGWVKAGKRGQADCSGVIVPYGYGEPIGIRLEIEVKAVYEDGRRGKRSPEQVAYGDRMLRMGAVYLVAWTLDDALIPIDKILRGESWK